MSKHAVESSFVYRSMAGSARLLAGLLAAIFAGAAPIAAAEPAEKDGDPSLLIFADISARAGVNHRHHTPIFDSKLEKVMPWVTAGGAGAAVGDFNRDGFDDIFVIDSRRGKASALYRNNGDWTFTDVASSAGVADLNPANSAAIGAVWLDYDNDGQLDLFVMRFGFSLLFQGQADGTFKDVTASAGVGKKHQNLQSGIVFDFDNDGKVDILVGGYFPDGVDMFQLESTRILHDNFEAATNGGSLTLYRNRGDGTFQDVTSAAGLGDTGWTLAIGHGDYDNDGWQDVYVANDFGTDRLYRNRGDGTFADVTAEAMGLDTKKGMCSEFGDYNNDGFLDIYVTNITSRLLRECNMLWSNNGDGTFFDLSEETGTCDSGWGWGAKFFDFDNDSFLDLYAVAGFLSGADKDNYWLDLADLATDPDRDVADALNWPPIGDKSLAGYEPNRLFHNQGDGTFHEIASQSGVADIRDGRGVALADFDNDGAMDLFVTNCNQPAALYRNLSRNSNHWLQVRLEGVASNRNAIGARVKLVAGSSEQIREVNGGNGFSAQSSFRLHFGLGEASKADRLEIRWPSGTLQTVEDPPLGKILEIVEKSN